MKLKIIWQSPKLFYWAGLYLKVGDKRYRILKSGLDGLADAMRVDDRKFRTTFDVADQIGGMVKVTISRMEGV